MCLLEDADVISVYSLEQALADGVLMKPFDDGKSKLVDNKPIVATTHLFHEVTRTQLEDIWAHFILWRTEILPNIPEEDRIFTCVVNGKMVWVDETPNQVTLMYEEDY